VLKKWVIDIATGAEKVFEMHGVMVCYVMLSSHINNV